MELKEGMYVRNEQGFILKISDKNIDGYKSYIGSSNIIKASYNIIDLVEKGDYVYGVEVEDINDKEIMLADTHLWIDKEVANRLIESIVTKEEFKNRSYEVE